MFYRLASLSVVSACFLLGTGLSTDAACTPQTCQYLVAIGDVSRTSGSDATQWGGWGFDPGSTGVPIDTAPAPVVGTPFWVEEHGLVMTPPSIPLSAGTYHVGGGSTTSTGTLAVQGDGTWDLGAATIDSVTHKPCKTAKYSGSGCDMENVRDQFPGTVPATGSMPELEGCTKEEYWVLPASPSTARASYFDVDEELTEHEESMVEAVERMNSSE